MSPLSNNAILWTAVVVVAFILIVIILIFAGQL
jgi:hypothetical protein